MATWTKEAQAKLDQAVQDFIKESGWDRGLILTSYVLVGHQHGYEDDGELRSGYPIIYMSGELPLHSILGLLKVGMDTARGIGPYGKDD